MRHTLRSVPKSIQLEFMLAFTPALPMNLLFGVPRLRDPDRLKAELQTRSRIHRFQGFNARNFSWNSLPEERLPRTSARLAPLNRVAANVGRASRLPSLRVRANEVVPTGAGE